MPVNECWTIIIGASDHEHARLTYVNATRSCCIPASDRRTVGSRMKKQFPLYFCFFFNIENKENH